MGRGMANARRFGCPVHPVMCLGDVNPHDTHGIVRSCGNRRLGTGGIGVPEEDGIVIEDRISRDGSDGPGPDGERVVLAATRDRGLKDDPVVPVRHDQGRLLLRYDNGDVPRVG
jgi:hypothetical protein